MWMQHPHSPSFLKELGDLLYLCESRILSHYFISSLMRLRQSFLSVLVLGLAIAGCKSATEPTTTTNAWKVPGLGSTYTFLLSRSDSSSSNIETGMDTVVYTVLGSGLHVDGKVDVVLFESALGTGYAYYAPNGDFMTSDSDSNGLNWTVFPTGSRGIITEPGWDSTDADGVKHFHSASRTYDGTERITLSSGSFDAIRIRESANDSETYLDGSTHTYHQSSYYWFVPSIGFFAKLRDNIDRVDTYSGGSDREHSQNSMDLISMNVK
jgi:hypothetical protein